MIDLIPVFKNTNYFWDSSQVREFIEDTHNMFVSLRYVNPNDLYKKFKNRQTSPKVVSKYVNLIKKGVEFDPVIISGNDFTDGGHRVIAYIKAGKDKIPVVDIQKLLSFNWEREVKDAYS